MGMLAEAVGPVGRAYVNLKYPKIWHKKQAEQNGFVQWPLGGTTKNQHTGQLMKCAKWLQTHHHHPIMNHVESWRWSVGKINHWRWLRWFIQTPVSLSDKIASRKSQCTCNRACWKKCVSTRHGLTLTRAIRSGQGTFLFALLSFHRLVIITYIDTNIIYCNMQTNSCH